MLVHWPTPSTMDEAKTLDALANVLNDISEKPYDFSLHVQHISLARSLQGMESELQSAIEMMSNFYSVGGDLWLELIEHKKASLDLGTVDGVAELLAVYERAESDYTCERRPSSTILVIHLVQRYLS